MCAAGLTESMDFPKSMQMRREASSKSSLAGGKKHFDFISSETISVSDAHHRAGVSASASTNNKLSSCLSHITVVSVKESLQNPSTGYKLNIRLKSFWLKRIDVGFFFWPIIKLFRASDCFGSARLCNTVPCIYIKVLITETPLSPHDICYKGMSLGLSD